MNVPLRLVRYRMGAEELIELGRPAVAVAGRRPFLSGRAAAGAARDPFLGQADTAGSFVTDRLGLALGFLGGVMQKPAELLPAAPDTVEAGASDLLKHVPSTGDVMAQVLVLGSTAVKFSMPLAQEVKNGLGNMLAGFYRALAGSFGECGVRSRIWAAALETAGKASGDRRPGVVRMLEAVLEDPPEIPEAGGPVIV